MTKHLVAAVLIAILAATATARTCLTGSCTRNSECTISTGIYTCGCDQDWANPRPGHFVCQQVNDFCGTRCLSDADCPNFVESDCTACVRGQCSRPVCGSNCTFSEQCPESCSECLGGMCVKAPPTNRTCGTRCTYDSECGNEECPSCINGQCDSNSAGPGCGKPCSSGCDTNNVCNYCPPGGDGGCTTYMQAARAAWKLGKLKRAAMKQLKKNNQP